MMRTTLNLDEDVAEAARAYAESAGISLGEAVSELVRRGLRPQVIDKGAPFPTFRPRNGIPSISLETTLAVEDEL